LTLTRGFSFWTWGAAAWARWVMVSVCAQEAGGGGQGQAAYVLAHIGVADEELGAQVVARDELVVGEGDGADACQDEVFGDLVGEGFDGDEEDVGGADLLLRLDAPESNLAVVEGDFVCSGV
jgi:hypothetical protein